MKLNGDGKEDGKEQGDTSIAKEDNQLVDNKNQLGIEPCSSKKKRWRRIGLMATLSQSREVNNKRKRKLMEKIV
ncbi:hypothetical protein PVK06_035901 [Gossypium arboreum]|uniref:Uncharacterized protein n=1 Tax=Gossypium arboreum TaxID=29729 RepID=A0ABR0NI10_GOSAR|nr:hypothetical protein PVK06_035901 [Gossypium arboreum]